MIKSKRVALTLTAVGIILAVVGPFLPGGTHLTAKDPPRSGHVTALSVLPGGDAIAGTQNGELWRLRGSLWTQERRYLGGQPVLAVIGEPGRTPIATGGGLFDAPVGAPPLDGRVGALLQSDQGLLAATAGGVRLLADGRWQAPGPAANVYALFEQRRGGERWLHAATIGSGVLSTPAAEARAPWSLNSQGLPDGVNVFCFATSRGGRLLAGTDQGLYWQDAPAQGWQLLHPSLAGRRVLALHLAPSDPDRLWIGSDDGLYWAELTERSGALVAPNGLLAADGPEYQPPVGVSWIVSSHDRLLISAGAVYEYGPSALAGWYWVSSLGVVLILLAAWWMPRPSA